MEQFEDDGDEPGGSEGSKAGAAAAKLIEALAAGMSQTEAAKVAGVSKRTVARRVAEPAFMRRVEQRRTAMVDEVVGRLGVLGLHAVQVISDCLISGEDGVPYKAAVDVLKLLMPYRRHHALELRVAALEQSPAEGQGHDERT